MNWLCFTARRSEDSSTQRLHHVMVSCQSLHSMTSCPPAYRWFRRDSLHATPQATSTIRPNIEIFHVMLSNLMFSQSVWCSAKLSDVTLHHLCVRCAIRHYTEPLHATLHCLYVRCTIIHYAETFHATLHRFCVRCAIRYYPEPFHTTLHRLYVRYAIRHCTKPFDATLHRMCVHCTIRHCAKPFDATLHRLRSVLQMSAKLFAI